MGSSPERTFPRREGKITTEQFKAATIRALYGAILIGFSTILGAYQALGIIASPEQPAMASGDRWEASLVAGGIAFTGYMIARGAAEGLIDSARNANGTITSADVGSTRR